jgi:outer membrane protein OmpA-like peptidoglycan-associated protein
MTHHYSILKSGLFTLGLSLAALSVVGCAGTGSDASQQPSSDTTTNVQQTAQSGSSAGTYTQDATPSEADERIAAVVKFAKEVELDNSAEEKTDGNKSSNMASTDETPSATHNELPQHYVFHFDTNSTSLDEEAKKDLKKHAHYLTGNPDSVVTISGHSDMRGASDYNIELSRKRAQAVADTLKSLGVGEDQIIIASHGEDVPMIDASNWTENRRVELEYMDDSMISTR